MSELISVIITVYNDEKFIAKCISSVLAQTYANLEIIIVNDNSSDSSDDICIEYADMDARIIYTSSSVNRGVSASRNIGLALASGTYVTFVDGDDFVLNTFIETLYNNLKNYEADISVCDYYRITEDEKPEIENEVPKITLYKEPLQFLSSPNWAKSVVVWNKLYKRDLFNSLIFMPHRVHQDEYIIHQVLYRANKLVETSSRQYAYIKHSASIMHNQSSSTMYDGWLAFCNRIKMLDDSKLFADRDIWLRRTAMNLVVCYNDSLKLPDSDFWSPIFRERLLMLLRLYPMLNNFFLPEQKKLVDAVVNETIL